MKCLVLLIVKIINLFYYYYPNFTITILINHLIINNDLVITLTYFISYSRIFY